MTPPVTQPKTKSSSNELGCCKLCCKYWTWINLIYVSLTSRISTLPEIISPSLPSNFSTFLKNFFSVTTTKTLSNPDNKSCFTFLTKSDLPVSISIAIFSLPLIATTSILPEESLGTSRCTL